MPRKRVRPRQGVWLIVPKSRGGGIVACLYCGSRLLKRSLAPTPQGAISSALHAFGILFSLLGRRCRVLGVDISGCVSGSWCTKKGRWGAMNFRSIYSLLSLVVVGVAVVAYFCSWNWINANINALSFIGGVLTIIGLVVAIGEVASSGAVATQIKKQLVNFQNQQAVSSSGSAISEVLVLLDGANSEIQSSEYGQALRSVQMARRSLNRVDSRMFLEAATPGGLAELFNKAEKRIMAASHSRPEAPLTPAQRANLSELVCGIKTKVENISRDGRVF